MKEQHFQSIAIVETNFQYSIAAYLKNNFSNELGQVYILDLRDLEDFDQPDGIKRFFNFNKPSQYGRTLRDLFSKSRIELSCELLISTFNAGMNCRYLTTIIKHKKKILIDDGIGTAVYVISHDYSLKERFAFPKFLFLTLCTTIRYLKMPSFFPLKTVSEYFSVYYDKLPNVRTRNISELFTLKISSSALTDKVAFIGAPLVEFGLISKKKYINIVREICNLNNCSVDYYLHRDEQHKEISDNCFIIRNGVSIEEFFLKNGFPKKVYAFTSSALLNLAAMKKQGLEIELYFIDEPLNQYQYSLIKKCLLFFKIQPHCLFS